MANNRKKWLRMGIGMMIFFIVLIWGGFHLITAIGRHRLQNKAASNQPELQSVIAEEFLTEAEAAVWQDGWIKYKNKIYKYNEEIMTFLIMGIDKGTEAIEGYEDEGNGQADALFLAVLNPVDKSIQIIGINRNTMTDIDIYDDNGIYLTTKTAQIAVQHGFGDGRETSCTYQMKAVQNLFYNLPIHEYAAVNLGAVTAINDAVGGVDVTVLQDLTNKDPLLVKDRQVHLMGESAYWYVKYRDTNVFGSADMRLARQKQYLTNFIDKAKQAVKSDVSIVLNVYQAIMPQIVTDISIDEIAYLASILPDYHFDENSIHTMEGETVMGERFEEFYPDETALYELILEVFYEEVGIVSEETNEPYETEHADTIDLPALQKENPDIFAWLSIPGTKVNCPVLQSQTADDFYQTHDASGDENPSGAVYIEAANLASMCDFNTVLHGNTGMDGTAPFADLYKFADPDFFKEHEQLYLYLDGNVLTYEIFAAYRREDTSLLRSYDFTEASGCQQFLNDLYATRDMSMNLRDGWENVSACHFIVTLTTQDSESADTQWVVVAVLIQDEAGTIQRTIDHT